MHAPIAIKNAGFANLFNASFQTGRITAAGFVLTGRCVELHHSAGASDRVAPAFPDTIDDLALTIPFLDIAAQHTAVQRTSELSFVDILQHLLVQHQICDDLL